MTTVKRVVLPRDEKGNDPNDHRDDPGYTKKMNGKRQPDMGWVGSFKLTKQEAEELTHPEWIYQNVIIEAHLIGIVAPPGAGKTTIALYLAGELASEYRVHYVNADVGQGDVKAMQEFADAKGFSLLLPDMKAGLSMKDVVSQLERMNEVNADYSGILFFFDTLKKMTDVINKTRAKELYKTLRGLTAKGMTNVLLGHTNKYNDIEGNAIYEGTADLRSDVDELIYFVPKKLEDGGLIVSTQPDKVRGVFRPITFKISTERTVTRLDDFIDVAAIQKTERQREKDQSIIEAVTEAIQSGTDKQVEIIDWCREHHGIGWRSVERILSRYRHPPGRLWRRRKAFQNNAWLYSLEDQSIPPVEWCNGETGGSGVSGETGDVI